ncbi:hypothetical protein ABBQ38_013525 [Trebouxia sp. C0009 RCD-2024]
MDENELGEHGVLDEPDVLGEHVASLHEAISQIQTPGVFHAGVDDSFATSPALVVPGVGYLSVPLPPEQTSQLQALCSPAPGCVDDATIDAEKCAAWQLDASQFQCTNPGWPAYVKTQAGKLLKQLGIASETIMHPELQNLILYQNCWDQETEDASDGSGDTAAMMIIVLPSQFKASNVSAGFNYELLDVEGGSKLALIYRLVQRSAGPLPVFQDNRDAVYTILQAAQEWEAEKLLPKRAIHMLDNEYDYHGGLAGGIADLIGRDQAVATALMKVQFRTGLQLYLAFITKAESGTATHTDVSWTADRWQDLDDGCLVGLESVDINAAEIMQGEDCFAEVKPDSEDEYDTGHYAPTRNISRNWRRAALVVWPRCHAHQLLCDSGQAPAVTVLNSKTYSAVWRRRKLTRAAAQLTLVHAVELAAAMAAAAEAAVSNPIALQEARTFAEAIWTRYSTKLFTPSDTPHRQFVHLIHELGMDKLALRIADKLKETKEEYNARRAVILRRSVLNKPTHGLCYPGPEDRSHYYQKLALTPSTAKELSLLAELVGWSPFLPIMLDMASRPDDLMIVHCTLSSGVGNPDMRSTFGGFKALRFLSRKSRGLGGQPLADVLPQMAASVAQICLHRNSRLFATGASASSGVQDGYRRFVAGVAFIISDLTKHVAEAGKSELKAVHDSFLEVYMKQPEDYCFAFFHDVIVPVCVSLAGSSKLKAKLAGCPVLQSLMQACKARLEELTKSAPQKPKDWALDVKVECDAKHGPSAPAADGLCMNCCRLQDFLQDAARTVFTATLSRAEAQHLQG